MHIVVSWDIQTDAKSAKWIEVNGKLREGLKGYSWVRPLTTFYVVRVASDADRTVIRDRLVEAAKPAGITVHIVISPAMAGGRYDGFLPKDTWGKLNERSDP